MISKQDRAKRLMAYSAAAGLGAFSFGQVSEGAIVHVDVPDVTLNVEGTEVSFNIDGVGYDDIKIQFVSFGSDYARVRGRSLYSTVALTDLNKSASLYYIRAFDAGTEIGFNANTGVVSGPGEIIKPTSLTGSGFGRAVDSYMGFALVDGANWNFGWMRIQTLHNPNPLPYGVADAVTVFEFAYETEPGVSIAAGAVPEPLTLGILAAGLGAVGLRRRAV
ncbi:MAG: PEP-CTERM sorting domain-containing protein [Phycisphaerales bacterium]